jgi:uncharacterized repeat protein (TIGR01451 family)
LNQSSGSRAPSKSLSVVTPDPGHPPALVPVKDNDACLASHEKPPAFRLVDAPPAPPVSTPVPPARLLAAERLPIAEKTVVPERPTVAEKHEVMTPLAPAAPTLSLEKIAPASVTLNRTASYEIVVHNHGRMAAALVQVEDQLPPDCQYLAAVPEPERVMGRLVWDLGNLEAGAERRIRVEFTPTRNLERLPGARIAYSAEALGRTVSQLGPTEAHAEPARILLKTSGPAAVPVGQPAVFQIEITNPTDTPATGLKLHDRLSAGLRHPQGNEIEADLGALAPHETRNVTLSATTINAGRQFSETTLQAPDGTAYKSQATVDVTESGLRVTQLAPPNAWMGQQIEVRIEAANPGATNVSNLRLRDVLPAGLEFVAAEGGGEYDPAGRCINWQLPVIPAGQARVLAAKVKLTRPGELVNRVSALAEQGPEVHSEAAIKVGAMAALELDATNRERQVEVGVETTYDIRISNRGSLPASGVQLLAVVPEGMTPTSGTGPTAYRVQGQQVIFAALARLEAGRDAVYHVTVRCLSRGDKRFRAQLTSDQSQLPLCKEEVTLVYSDRN